MCDGGKRAARRPLAPERLSENGVGGGEKDDEVYAEHPVNGESESIPKRLLSGGIYITRPRKRGNNLEKSRNKLVSHNALLRKRQALNHLPAVKSLTWLSCFSDHK